MDKSEFAARLSSFGMTTEEFAELSKTSAYTVDAWGRGSRPVPHWARLVLDLIEDRGGLHGMLGRPRLPPAIVITADALFANLPAILAALDDASAVREPTKLGRPGHIASRK